MAGTEAGQCLNINFHLEVSANRSFTINIYGRECYPVEKVITLSLLRPITRSSLNEHELPGTPSGKIYCFYYKITHICRADNDWKGCLQDFIHDRPIALLIL